MSSKIKVIDVGELPPGKVVRVEVQGEAIAIANSGGRILALEDSCPHSDWPLSNGDLDGKTLTCLLQGAEFDVMTGCSVESLAGTNIPTFSVVVKDA